MFVELGARAASEISTIRAALKVSESVRKLLAENNGDAKRLQTRLPSPPELPDWRIYDHCAALTRLYSVFAAFVEDLLEEWLLFLSRSTPKYQDLEERVRNQHRDGVGRILLQIQHKRYRALTTAQIISGLHNGLNDGNPYELLPQAYFSHDRNYGPEILETIFRGAGVDRITQWFDRHRFVRSFIVNIKGDSTTYDAELKNFLEYRNDAAHGRVDNFLGTEALLQTTDFIGAIIGALVERILEASCKLREERGETLDCGSITEVFTKAHAVVVKVANVTLRKGEPLILRGECFCRLSTINSIQIDGNDVEAASSGNATEVGLALGDDVRKGLRLCKYQT
jgi:hypothetical protein